MSRMPKRVGFACGAFDPLHFGHVRMLLDGAAQCDELVVGLHVDPSKERPWKGKPVQTVDQREEVLRAIRGVHDVVRYHTEQDLVELLSVLRPDVRVLGTDYKGKRYTGDHLGIPIHWHQRDHSFSATAYRQGLAVAWEQQRARTDA